MDLSKAFDCIDHNLLIAKVSAYGSGKQSINFRYSQLTKLKQRTKVDSVVAHGECYFQVCLKAPFQDHFYSICISVTCFLKHQQILTFLDMQMTILLTHNLQIQKLARQSTRSIRKNFSFVFNKSLNSKCKKISPVKKL